MDLSLLLASYSPYVLAALAVSEALALIPALRSNSILTLVGNVLRQVVSLLKLKK